MQLKYVKLYAKLNIIFYKLKLIKGII